MGHSSEVLKTAIEAAKETLQSLLNLDSQVAKGADLIEKCLRAGNKLLVCGNGGSAADASHFATEFVVRFMKDRPAYPAICLAGDGGLLTAAGNDYGFDEIFARQVAAFGLAGDLLICLTTSGKSRNVDRALQEAKARQLKTIVFLGRDGGSTLGLADVDILVRSNTTARIQEAHQLLLHVLCEVGGQTTDSEFRNFVEDRIDRAVNVIRFRRTTGSHIGNNMELRLGRETCFQCVPPGKFRSRAMYFNE